MPRACLPNGRFLASADSPLLPLLAPRVFGDTPIPRKGKRHNDRTTQKVQKKERPDGRCRDAVAQAKGSERGLSGWGGGRCLRLAHSVRSAGLLQTSFPAMRTSSARFLSESLGLCYADISSFARQQLRSYSIAKPNTEAQDASRISAKAHRFTRRGRGPRNSAFHVADTPTVNGEIGADVKIRRVASTDRGQGRRAVGNMRFAWIQKAGNAETLLQTRRRRAARAAQKRLKIFLSYAPRTDRAYLMRQGRYRSLRRRVFNLEQRKATIVDLRQRGNQFGNHLHAFAALDRQIYGGLKRIAQPVRIQHNPQCASWAAALFQDVDSHQEKHVWKRWLNIEGEARENWSDLLVFLLHRSPGEALLFLRLLTRETSVEKLKPEILADALEHLAKLHARRLYVGDSWKTERKISWNRSIFVPTFYHIFRDHLSSHRGMCSQDLLLNIANLASIEDLKRVFDLLVEVKANMLYDTLLHYANAFATAGEHRYALLCLKRIATRAAEGAQRRMLVNRRRFRWTCALIIRKSMVNGESYHETTPIVAALVGLGVRLDIMLYNAIISNAMEAGDYVTAFRVYNSLTENGLKPDKHTFSILLHGCTKTNDPAKFHDFAGYCAQIAKELRDPWLATDYLYYLYLRLDQEDRHGRQEHIHLSRAYLNFFSIDPLKPFWSQTQLQEAPADHKTSTNDFTPMPPPPVALYIMLQAEIRYAASTSNNHVWNLYRIFRRLIRADHHPMLNKLARDPVIWNAFLLAFCQKQQFGNASRLIKDMTEHSPQPNVYSWNIFMQGFFKTSQVQAAERVYEIMRSRGVDPDQFSYGTLLRGYIKVQHIDKIGAVMERVDNEQQMDPQLLQTLARVHARKRLMVAMEKGQSRKEQREREEAAAAAAQEEERWMAPLTFSPMLHADSSSAKVEATGAMSQFRSLWTAVPIAPTTVYSKVKKESTGKTDYVEGTADSSISTPSPVSSFGSSLGYKSILPRKYEHR